MNFTGGNTLPNIGRRIDWHLVMLAAGLAIALSVAALNGAFQRDSSPAGMTVARSGPVTIPGPVSASGQGADLIYIVTGSRLEADLLSSTLTNEAGHFPELADYVSRISVVALETAEQEAQFNRQLWITSLELTTVNSWVRVVDLRTPAAATASFGGEGDSGQASPIVYLVSSQAEKVALEQQFHESGAIGDTTQRSVFVLEGPDANLLYSTIIADQMQHGTFEIVDLRN